METEIILTEDPNVVIEVSTVRREINIEQLRSEADSITIHISTIDQQIDKLRVMVIPEEIQYIVNNEISALYISKLDLSIRLATINEDLLKIL